MTRFMARKIRLTCLTEPTTLAELQHIQKKVDSYKICLGGCSTENFKTARPECAKKDGNRWRHKKCLLILDRGTVCKYCVDVPSRLRQWEDRNCIKKGRKRTRLQTTPRTRKKIDEMRGKARALQRQLERRTLQLELIKSSIEMSKKNADQLQDEVQTEIANSKIDKNQVTFFCNRIFQN